MYSTPDATCRAELQNYKTSGRSPKLSYPKPNLQCLTRNNWKYMPISWAACEICHNGGEVCTNAGTHNTKRWRFGKEQQTLVLNTLCVVSTSHHPREISKPNILYSFNMNSYLISLFIYIKNNNIKVLYCAHSNICWLNFMWLLTCTLTSW